MSPRTDDNGTASELTEADFGSLQILQNAYWLVQFKGRLADQPDAAMMIVMCAVGEVEAQGSRPLLNQAAEYLGFEGGGSDSGNDFCPAGSRLHTAIKKVSRQLCYQKIGSKTPLSFLMNR